MTDREAVARALCKAAGYNPDRRIQHDRYAFEWERFSEEADAAIACLRERWTSEAAVTRAWHQVSHKDGTGQPRYGLSSEELTKALTAAMRDEA